MRYQAVIGLEVHAQLLTQSKIFCGCSTRFGEQPNANTCPVCLGLPGVLPVLNRKVVEYAVMMGLATGCSVAPESVFARKNYFYPDLPKGYQISQYELPLCTGGSVDIKTSNGTRRIGITRIHVEEDAGKLVHAGTTFDAAHGSYVDLNRAGVPLIEIVSEPDLRTPGEAREYMQTLHGILVDLRICDGNMEEGSLRCDANVSIMPEGSKTFGTRSEIKNMNSFRFLQEALEYEIERQTELLEGGGKVVQETRLWDSAKGVTISMRGKEEAHDYRYFPDPDLVPVRVASEWVEEIRTKLPELRQQKKERFEREMSLTPYSADVIASTTSISGVFETLVTNFRTPPVETSKWMLGPYLQMIKENEGRATNMPLQFQAYIIQEVIQGNISGTVAKAVFEESCLSGVSPQDIIQQKNLAQVSDEGAIRAAVDEVIAAHPGEVAAYRGGKDKLIGFLVGQVMKRMGGKANPQVVNRLLTEAIRR